MSTPPDSDDPLLPFAGATGHGVRVAVIDSGANPGHPHIGPISGGASVAPDARIEEGVFLDLLGHGTAVMAAIQEKAHEAEYFALRVFESTLRTSADALRCAIDWCLERRMDVVNLSLGTRNHAYREMFVEAAARAVAAGTLVVAAREADGVACYPGCLPGVFGVDVDWDCPRNVYRLSAVGEQIVLHASGYPRPIPGVPARRNLQGVSFAVANASGFVVRACEAAGRGPERVARVTEALAAQSYQPATSRI